MKKAVSILVVLFSVFALMTGCRADYQDGVYHAEFQDYDSHGWKEYVDVQVEGNQVTVLTFDGINAEGDKKSEDESYRTSMEPVKGTYPAKFYTDIINQYLETGKLDDVTTVAGATLSTDNFRTLMLALEESMKSGDTTPVIVDSSSSQ